MGNSLQDQLLKAGLANKKQAVRAKKAKNSKEKLKRTGKQVVDEAAELAHKAEQEKLARDKELNRVKNEQAERKAIEAQIVQLVELNRLDRRGEIDFSFTEDNLVKSIRVDAKQREALVNGQLAVVKIADAYDVVPRGVADKIALRSETAVIVLNEQDNDQPVDDEYADFVVPDDLMW